MTIKQWKLLMNLIMVAGIFLMLAGMGLYAFTDLAWQGVQGMQKIVMTIGAGLVLLTPCQTLSDVAADGHGKTPGREC